MSKIQLDSTSDEITWGDDYIQQECHCCLCGKELVYQHVFDFLAQKVTETSSCSTCKIEMKTQEHSIH